MNKIKYIQKKEWNKFVCRYTFTSPAPRMEWQQPAMFVKLLLCRFRKYMGTVTMLYDVWL